MKCVNCPCSCVELDDWECMAHMEDDMYEDESGCNLTESQTTEIAMKTEESRVSFFESYLDWLEKDKNGE